MRCNQISYYLYDGRGSVTANTWYNGMVTNVYQYDPYGQVELGSTKHTDFYGYNAESYNPNSGLEYLRARYYNANQGRFFQEDTYLGDIIDPLTLNRYAYGKNSPMNYVDPSGHSIDDVMNSVPSTLNPHVAQWQKEHNDWSKWSDSVGKNMNQSQRNRLADAMMELDQRSKTGNCGEEIELTESSFDFIVNFVIGAIIAQVDNVTVYRKFVNPLEEYGCDSYSEFMLKYMVTNSTAFYLGKMVGDFISLHAGLELAATGIGGMIGGAITSLNSGGLTLQITAAGVAVTGTGAAIAVNALGDIMISKRMLMEEAIAFASSSGSGDNKGNIEADMPDYKKENRVPLDKETVLKGDDYQKTGKIVKGAQVYKKGNQYYYRDTFHTGESAHLEVFDKQGKHLGEADPLTGILQPGTADPTKTININ